MTDTHNHRWKRDPRFVQGFDYDHPKHAHVPADQKWMLPLFEAQKDPAVIADHKRMEEAAVARVMKEKLHAYRKSVPDLVGLAVTQANKALENSESGSCRRLNRNVYSAKY